MRATREYAERKFDEFNRRMFEGKLPKLPVELSDAKTFLGVCVCKKRRDKNGRVVNYDFRLRINTRIDLPEDVVEDTIIHEMIHYYIGVNQLKDSSAHGQLFRRIMNHINQTYHRHVTISFKGNKEQNGQAVDTRPRWHVIAKVKFADGHTGVKVLPRVLQSVLRFYNVCASHKDITGTELFMSNNVFFNQYPNSSALRVTYVDEALLDRHLAGARRLICDGKRIGYAAE